MVFTTSALDPTGKHRTCLRIKLLFTPLCFDIGHSWQCMWNKNKTRAAQSINSTVSRAWLVVVVVIPMTHTCKFPSNNVSCWCCFCARKEQRLGQLHSKQRNLVHVTKKHSVLLGMIVVTAGLHQPRAKHLPRASKQYLAQWSLRMHFTSSGY